MSHDDPNDGFDLIEYPLDFVFKAMCRTQAEQSCEQHIREWLSEVIESDTIKKMSTNTSRTGKFDSVSITIYLQSREQLETIYQRLADSPQVVMTL